MKQGKRHLVMAIVCLSVFLLAGISLVVYLRSGGKTLVAYFTRVGNTDFIVEVDAVSSASINKNLNGELEGNSEIIARILWRISGGDLFAIESTENYPQDYDETVSRARTELSNQTRPMLVSDVANMEQYDRVILIYPVWWGTAPMPVFSFLEKYDFSGKEILPIATHKGSFLGSSVSDIKESAPEARITTGIPVSGGSARFIVWIPAVLLIGIFLVIAGDFIKTNNLAKAGSVVQILGILVFMLGIVRLLLV